MHKVVIRETMSRRGLVHNVVIALGLLVFCAQLGWSQARLSAHWEDLPADDFHSAIKQSQGTAIALRPPKSTVPTPLGTDLLCALRGLHAAEQECAVAFRVCWPDL
jgi:hypothetical protein